MVKLRCIRCNYLFKREFVPKICPQCGEENTLKKELDASELLEEL